MANDVRMYLDKCRDFDHRFICGDLNLLSCYLTDGSKATLVRLLELLSTLPEASTLRLDIGFCNLPYKSHDLEWLDNNINCSSVRCIVLPKEIIYLPGKTLDYLVKIIPSA